MTIEQAKSELMQIYGALSPNKQMAIDVLVKIQPCEDAISRQSVLDTIDSYMSHHMGLLDLKLFVTELSPVNPIAYDVPIMCDVLEYLETTYVGARACDDVEEQVRLARAIAAYKQDVHEDCEVSKCLV